MKNISLFVLILVVGNVVSRKDEVIVLRYKNGTLKTEDTVYHSLDGSFVDIEDGAMVYGMHMPSFTPYVIFGVTSDVKDKYNREYLCALREWGRDDVDMLEGTITTKGTASKVEISGDCEGTTGPGFTFSSVGAESKTFFYPPAEAGLRAKNLIDQNNEKFEAAEVIGYAIVDIPYSDGKSCGQEYKDYPDAPRAGPGVIILGNDGKHCAIFDNEGTKFIHSNPNKKKVTYESIALINTYFPKGYTYKAYPDEIRSLILNRIKQ